MRIMTPRKLDGTSERFLKAFLVGEGQRIPGENRNLADEGLRELAGYEDGN